MDELGKSFPAAEGMVDAEQSTKARLHNEVCLNCGTKLVDIYCHHCGQKDIPRRQTLAELFSNFISSFWSYEGKFFLTTKYLITRPGFLASEYNAGRRESYYHPARMYVFVSFVFFLLYFSLPDAEEQDKDAKAEMTQEDLEELREDLKEQGLDSIYGTMPDSVLMDSVKQNPTLGLFGVTKKKRGINLSSAEYESVAAYDSAQLAKSEIDRHGWFMRKLSIRSIELNQKYKDKGDQFGKDFGQSFMDNFSKVLFWLLPFFALLLKLFYIRRDFYYSEHLVLTIYYYNFFYLAASIMMLINLIPGIGFIVTIIGFWIYFYFLFAMKRTYGQRWGKTILKFVLFSVLFSFLIWIGVAINAMATLMLI